VAAQDAELALRSGQGRMRLHRYPEAARDLAEAARLAPADGETQLALAKARYHARDLPGARTALEAAGSLRPDDAEVALYRGMLQIEAGDDAAAIASLARALRLDAERVDPVASYHLAMARARTRDASGAETDLRRVADAWQGTLPTSGLGARDPSHGRDRPRCAVGWAGGHRSTGGTG
jgi:tetratricopeptide (TPR) repeat protein